MRQLFAATAAAAVLALSACGSDAEQGEPVETVQGGGDGGGAAPDSSTSASPTSAPSTGPTQPTGPGAPEVVEPRAGMDNIRPVRWESAKSQSERVVRVRFYGGVAPCDVLDSVEVDYRSAQVAISLFSGSDPAEPDAVCIQIAKLKVVDVELTEDLEGRTIVDGNAAG